jgi:hypothetical protein
MIKRSYKILLLLAAFYYAAQAELSVQNRYTYDFAIYPVEAIAVTQLFEPDFSWYYLHLAFSKPSATVNNNTDFASQWRLSAFHYNRYIAIQFGLLSKKTLTYQPKLATIHTKNILYLKEFDDIPHYLI